MPEPATDSELPRLASELKVLAARLPALLAALAGGKLTPAFRERVMLAVINELRCRYCNYIHSTLGCYYGLKPEEVADPWLNASTPERAALDFARLWTVADPGIARRTYQTNLAVHYAQDELAALEGLIAAINVANRAGNSYDEAFARTATEPRSGLGRGSLARWALGAAALPLLSPLLLVSATMRRSLSRTRACNFLDAFPNPLKKKEPAPSP